MGAATLVGSRMGGESPGKIRHQQEKSKTSKTNIFPPLGNIQPPTMGTLHAPCPGKSPRRVPFSPFSPQAPTQVRHENGFLGWGWLGGLFSFPDEQPRLVGNIIRLFSAPLSVARETGRKKGNREATGCAVIRGTFPKIEAFHSFFTRRQQLLMLYETVNPAWSSRREPVSAPGLQLQPFPECGAGRAPQKPAWGVGNEQLEARPRL